MPSLHTNTGAKRARQARSELGLDGGQPLECVLSTVERDLGIPVVLAALPAGIAGCCTHTVDGVVLFASGTDAAVRCRFTLAHELGHVRCGHDASVRVDTYETIFDTQHDPNEVQANAFAAEFLAPASGVTQRVEREPTLEDVVALAAEYGISTIAALYRLNTLGLTGRYETLRAEIDAGEHEPLWEHVEQPGPADVIAGLDGHLPRLSPQLAGSALDALLRRESAIEDVACAAGCSADTLAGGAALIDA